MSYQPEFLTDCWEEYLSTNNMLERDVDPDDFIRWTFSRAMHHREPRYAAIARNWGITVTSRDMSTVRDAADFSAVIETALAAR